MFTRYLPAELLKEVNVVDTPGTNVILGRQQRLTEEYVPRADLVSGWGAGRGGARGGVQGAGRGAGYSVKGRLRVVGS